LWLNRRRRASSSRNSNNVAPPAAAFGEALCLRLRAGRRREVRNLSPSRGLPSPATGYSVPCGDSRKASACGCAPGPFDSFAWLSRSGQALRQQGQKLFIHFLRGLPPPDEAKGRFRGDDGFVLLSC
jgi:hypothetical protein